MGGTTSAAVLVIKSVASPIGTPGLRLKKSVTLVNWLRWFTACGPSDVFQVTRAFSGTRCFPSSDLMYRSERSPGWARAESFRFQDNLILIFRLLDQVEIILRVGVSEQGEYARLRYTIHFGLVAPDLDVEIGRVVEVIGGEVAKPRVRPQSFH